MPGKAYWTIREVAEEIARRGAHSVARDVIMPDLEWAVIRGLYPALEPGDEHYDKRYTRLSPETALDIAHYWTSEDAQPPSSIAPVIEPRIVRWFNRRNSA